MRELRNARIWGNVELKKIAGYCSGNVINVSGEKDDDKMGGKYRDYFVNAKSYSISNYELKGIENEIHLDLEKDLPDEMKQRYDVVYNNTVLEHIYEIRKAFSNLCFLSNELVILIVPFEQEVHYKKGIYFDYWRPTPLAIERMFEENGFKMIYFSYNNMKDTNIYFFCVGVRQEQVEKYSSIYNIPDNYYGIGDMQPLGSEWKKENIIVREIKKIKKRLSNKN